MEADDVYLKLAEKLKYPPSERLLRILRKTITAEEGQLLVELPKPVDELAAKLGCSQEYLNNKLEELFKRGLVVVAKKGYYFPRSVVQLHDSSLSVSEEFIDTELLDLWKELYQAELRDVLGKQWASIGQPLMKVLPAHKALEQSPGVSRDDILAEEDATSMVKGAESIAVVPCPCRRAMRQCDAPVDGVCLQFDRAAETALRKGAKRLSVQEALAAVDLAEDKGLIHVVPVRSSLIMCNCCGDCCLLINPCREHGTLDKGLIKSRYVANIDGEACTGCEVCIDRCQLGAIQMRESPSSKEPKAVVMPEQCFGCGVCVLDCAAGAIAMRLAVRS